MMFGHSSYAVFGVIAAIAGATVTSALAIATATPIAQLGVVLVVPPAALVLTLALSRAKLLPAPIVFYEKALTALALTALVLAISGQPVAPGVDLASIGIAVFLAIGRIGCFSVSCCHGRRARIGVRYGWTHAAAGFPVRWVGLPVFPIQLVDAAAAATSAAYASVIELSRHAPGAPLAAVCCTYGVARFAIELARGDDARRYIVGASVPQWTAVATTTFAAIYHPSPYTSSCAGALLCAALALAVARSRRWWLHVWLVAPRHLVEIEAVLCRLVADGPTLTTSEGLQLSMASCPHGGLALRFAHSDGSVSVRTVLAIGAQLGRDWMIEPALRDGALVLHRDIPPDALAF